MKGLVFDTENRMQFKDFGEPLLDNLQKEVGGCIEVVHPKYLPEGLCMVMAIVECQCQTRSYEDRNGQKRTATEFVVQKIHFCGPKTEQRVDDGGEAPPPGYQQSYQQPSYQNQQPQQMGFATQNQRQQWQQSAPGGQQPSYSQGDPDDFSVIDDSDDLPF